jgi:hypothetical protein
MHATESEYARDYFYYRVFGIEFLDKKEWLDSRVISYINLYTLNNTINFAKKGFNSYFIGGTAKISLYDEKGWDDTQGIIYPDQAKNDSVGKKIEKGFREWLDRKHLNENLNIINSIIQTLKSRNAEVIFFAPPETDYFSKFCDPYFVERTNMIMDSICRINNCRYLNYQQDKRFSEKDFVDVGHLNRWGARKFTEALIKDYNFRCN